MQPWGRGGLGLNSRPGTRQQLTQLGVSVSAAAKAGHQHQRSEEVQKLGAQHRCVVPTTLPLRGAS